jgi:prepilin-type N-terminal cleavage/methylation domain-containing protein
MKGDIKMLSGKKLNTGVNYEKRCLVRFTLIELLVVIGIIALLAALLLPAIGAVQTQAQKTKAKSMANAIILAVKQYENTYGILPVPSVSGTDDVILGGGTNDQAYDDLIACLSLVDGPNGNKNGSGLYNPRKTRFLEVSSLYDDVGYVDPWDNRFIIGIDANYDNEVKNLDPGGATLHGKVFVYSRGPDGADGGADDIKTWE